LLSLLLGLIERLWLIMNANWFTDFIATTRDNLIPRLDDASRWLIDCVDGNRRTCAIEAQL